MIIEIEYEDERGRYLALTLRPAEIEGDEDEDEDGEEVTLDPHLQEHLILGPDPVATPEKIQA